MGNSVRNNNNQKRVMLFAGFLLAILVLITYSGATKNNFVDWDDNDYVVNNELVRNSEGENLKEIFTTVVSLNYHPLTILSLRLNSNICNTCQNGISAKPFIWTNIILHILNSILVLFLIFLLFKENLILAFLVAAIFGVHPMHVESVAWISGRKDVLSSFFLLSGLIVYIKFKTENNRKYIWLFFSFLLFVLSCLSKATAVVFPLILILINFWISNKGKDKSPYDELFGVFSAKNLLPLLPFFAVSVFFGLMAVHIQSGENFLGMFKFIKNPHDVVNTMAPFSVLQRFQIASYGLSVYLVKFLFPFKQSVLYPYPLLNEFNHGTFSIFLWFSLVIMIITLILVIYSLRKTKLYFFGFGFYFITLVFVLQFISVGMALLAERYTYLPYIGLSLIPATLITNSSIKIKKALLFFSGCFIIIMMILASRQIKVWYDSATLWSQVIERHPSLELARSARGKFFYMLSSHAKTENEKKMLENKALIDFEKAIKANTKTADVYEGMGVISQSRNDFTSSLQYLNKAISLRPDKGRTYYNRAITLDMLNRKEESIKDYTSALALSPEMALEILSNRSVLYIETGKFREAISDLDSLISINSRNFMYYSNRAYSKLQLKDIDGAIDDYRKVLQLRPDDQVTAKQLQALIASQKK